MGATEDRIFELPRVVMAFVPAFVTPEGAEANRAAWVRARELRAEHAEDPEAARFAIEAWWDPLEPMPATIAQVAGHIDHVRAGAGADHVVAAWLQRERHRSTATMESARPL